jgi:DNA polymerase III alpha subunit
MLAGRYRACPLAAREHGLKLITGSEFRLQDGLRLVLLAANLAGYRQLCALITRARRMRGAQGGLPADARRTSRHRWMAASRSGCPAP